MRGVPINITEKMITSELIEKNYEPLKITRMYKHLTKEHTETKTIKKTYNTEKNHMPLILVKLPRSEHSKNIYNIDNMFMIRMRVEIQRASAQSAQCHRCGLGDIQRNCHLESRCIKCGLNHLAITCKNIRDSCLLCKLRRGSPFQL